MSYNDFDGSSSTLTADERRLEATRICEMLLGQNICSWSSRELEFLSQIRSPYADVSPKQLFWLRDLKEKYLDF